MRSVTREDAPQALPRVVAPMKKCEGVRGDEEPVRFGPAVPPAATGVTERGGGGRISEDSRFRTP